MATFSINFPHPWREWRLPTPKQIYWEKNPNEFCERMTSIQRKKTIMGEESAWILWAMGKSIWIRCPLNKNSFQRCNPPSLNALVSCGLTLIQANSTDDCWISLRHSLALFKHKPISAPLLHDGSLCNPMQICNDTFLPCTILTVYAIFLSPGSTFFTEIHQIAMQWFLLSTHSTKLTLSQCFLIILGTPVRDSHPVLLWYQNRNIGRSH